MKFAADYGAQRVLEIWIAAFGIAAVALTAAFAGLFTPWLLIITAVSGGVTVFAFLWYPPHYADSLSGSFDGAAVRAVKGVFWRKELFVPVEALRTIEMSATPVQRMFHCRTVILRFAGGSALLPLLPEEQARSLTAALQACDK
ncbi:hypothetical protein SDC9_159653 [bioreactor metagenome]|uniref:YdbS-like PH domain-containing protein n=1 Tax=bioreactor metagenome TaxID=1076179 RepID=A0A645FDE2_9ZZZZ